MLRDQEKLKVRETNFLVTNTVAFFFLLKRALLFPRETDLILGNSALEGCRAVVKNSRGFIDFLYVGKR